MNIDTITYNKAASYPINHGYGPVVDGGPAKRSGSAITSIIIHTTNGSVGSTLTNEANFLYASPEVSAHFLVGKQGQILQILDPQWIAWHVGAVNDPSCDNAHSIGIENHFTPGEVWTDNMHTALGELVLTLLRAYPSITKVVTHRSVAIFTKGAKKGQLGRKIDPSGWSDRDFNAWRDAIMIKARAPERVVEPQPGRILNQASARLDQAINCTIGRGRTGEYTAYDVRSILGTYWKYATAAGVDPALLAAQMLNETGNLSSWWAARPRRNPAGIGVTGETTRKKPNGPDWQHDAAHSEWRRGYAFASWDLAVRAHVGHILCYALRDEQMNTTQHELSLVSPRRFAIPEAWRGTAVHVTDLGGKWATVPDYGKRILSILAEIQRY